METTVKQIWANIKFVPVWVTLLENKRAMIAKHSYFFITLFAFESEKLTFVDKASKLIRQYWQTFNYVLFECFF